ncbi:MAG: hypothetical protein LBO74_01680 [Candidatus Symbiothrix sp.]|jgi:hypothetical protein|nr:hypothetical protein [Candidatus Symbiothrix sp.]
METTILKKKSIISKKKAVREKLFVDIPQSDIQFFKLFADKMGWFIDNKQNLWDKYIESSPKDIDLSDEDIMNEVRAVRYGKM